MYKSIQKAAVVAMVFLSGFSFAQKITGKSTKVNIAGTSTLHKWDMNASTATFTGVADGNNIKDVKFVMAPTALKSNESAMDKNAYKALKTDKYNTITFVAANITPVNGKANINGKLTIAGVTKAVNFPATVVKNGASYTIKATETIKMTDYGVTPPTFMMGAVKTGNDLTINVNIVAN